MMISPNPGIGEINLSVNSTQKIAGQNATFELVSLFDMQGNLKKRWNFNKVQSAKINVSEFKFGQYYLEINLASYIEKKLLLIGK